MFLFFLIGVFVVPLCVLVFNDLATIRQLRPQVQHSRRGNPCMHLLVIFSRLAATTAGGSPEQP